MDEIRKVLEQLQAVVDRFSSLPLEFEARGLEGDVPVPSAVFLEAMGRLSHLTVSLATTQVNLSQALMAALLRSEQMREDAAAEIGGLKVAVEQQGQQMHALAKTLHQLTVALTRSPEDPPA